LAVAAALALAQCLTLPSAAYAANASTPPAVSQPVPQQGSPNCLDFTMPVIVDGEQRQAFGQACRQPDGSWQVTQNTPGLPLQVYTLPAEAIQVTAYPYQYYWADPGGFGPPFFAGGFCFGNRFHHFGHKGFVLGGFHGAAHHGASHHGSSHGGFHGGGHR
jgi:hypothetical protein